MSTGLIHVDLSDTVGVLQIGSTIAVFLFGIVTLQVHFYYATFREDGWKLRSMVGALWLMELGHTIGVAFEVYRATITLYGQPHLLITFPALSSVTVLGGAITFLVQSFFALRVYRVIPKPYGYIGFACIAISFTRFVGSIVLTIAAATAESIAVYRIEWKWLIISLLSTGAVVDVTVAIAMLYYLYRARGQALSRSTTIIDKLIGYTLRSGLLTSLSAIVLLACFLSKPETMSWLALYTFLAKLYSNSLLSVLNGRDELRVEASHSASVERIRTGHGRRDTHGNQLSSRCGVEAISIEMKTTTETMQDDDKTLFRNSYLAAPGLISHQPPPPHAV